VTVDPNLDWLADEEGNLRPQIARELANAPPPEPAPQPRPRPEPVHVAGHVVRQLVPALTPRVVRPVARTRVPVPLLVGGILLAGMIGFAAGRWRGAAIERSAGSAVPDVSAAVAGALVNGTNVNLRSGPGLRFPVLARMTPGEAVEVRGEQAGWCSVTTSTGVGGWVFGAFLRGIRTDNRGAAVVTRFLASDGGGPRVVLRPGDKVFVERQGDGSTEIVLPSGRRLRVSPDVLAPAD
jgi:uncharacterized protein YraI